MTPLWTRRVADEFWSGPVTPLTYSLLAETMADHMVRRVLRQAGLGRLATTPVLLRSSSHVYVNGTLLAEVVGLLPPVLRSHGLLQLLPPEVRSRVVPASALTATARTAQMAARFALQEPAWSPWQRATAFEGACAAVRTRFTPQTLPAADLPLADLVRALEATRADLGAYLESVSWGVVYAYVFYHLLHELCRRWAPGLDADHAALTVGLPRVASLEAAREITDLGTLLARDPAAVTEIRNRPAEAATIVTSRGGAPADALQRLIVRHGHRLVGRDLACPTWRESPETVLGLALRSLERQVFEDAAHRRIEATARVEAAVAHGGLLHSRMFHAALDAARRYYVVRENMRYYADFFLARMRELALQTGAHLAAAGRLSEPLDVFFLTFDELAPAGGAPSQLAAPASPGPLAAFVAERRQAMARDSAAPPPATLAAVGDAEESDREAISTLPRAVTTAPQPDAITSRPPLTLRGECAAPGRCQGRARVVRDTVDFPLFTPGDVMVAGYTDPGWTPLLELASGLVLDAGGQLSHGAIVARELGIPALVNVADATRTIRNGDQLDLDATAGVLRIERG